MVCHPSRPEKLKIVVFGPYHVGKTSFIHSIDPAARHTEAISTGGSGTTVAFDYGRTTIGNRRIYLFGTPGQDRFDFARNLIARGLDGAILIVDAGVGIQQMHRELWQRLRRDKVPVAFFINRNSPRENIPSWRDTLKGEPVYEISSLDTISSRRALEAFVPLISSPENTNRMV